MRTHRIGRGHLLVPIINFVLTCVATRCLFIHTTIESYAVSQGSFSFFFFFFNNLNFGRCEEFLLFIGIVHPEEQNCLLALTLELRRHEYTLDSK